MRKRDNVKVQMYLWLWTILIKASAFRILLKLHSKDYFLKRFSDSLGFILCIRLLSHHNHFRTDHCWPLLKQSVPSQQYFIETSDKFFSFQNPMKIIFSHIQIYNGRNVQHFHFFCLMRTIIFVYLWEVLSTWYQMEVKKLLRWL